MKGIVLMLIITGFTAESIAQDDSSQQFAAGLPESYLRKSVVEKVMPSYPDEALRDGISGLVRLKVEIGIDGEVRRIKVKPKTNTQLSKTAGEALRQWRFKPFPDQSGLRRSSLGRLTFSFIIIDGVGKVQLHDPGPDAPDTEHLGYYNSPKEFQEWEIWEEITKK
jgi:TonB family protein